MNRVEPASVLVSIRASLQEVATPAAKAQASAYFKGPVKLLGVRASDIHRIARQAHASVKSDWSREQVVHLTDLLLEDPHLETQTVACVFLGRFKRSLDPALLSAVEDWFARDRFDTWAVVDTLCGHVLGPLVTAHAEVLPRLKKWLASKNLWMRRAALVSLTAPARRGQLLDRAYAFAARLRNDPEDLVQKAAGWLLRDAGKTDPDRLRSFLDEHGSSMARTTLRYAIEKFPAADRQRILRDTKARS